MKVLGYAFFSGVCFAHLPSQNRRNTIILKQTNRTLQDIDNFHKVVGGGLKAKCAGYANML